MKLRAPEDYLWQSRPQVCGIDDRADGCTDEICDRLMRYHPISGKRKHIEPSVYIEDHQVMGIAAPNH